MPRDTYTVGVIMGNTFKSISYIQFRRAILLCSEEEQRNDCIQYIAEKLQNSGYKTNEIEYAMKRALNLKRDDLLQPKKICMMEDGVDTQKQLTFTVNRNDEMAKKIRAILKDNQCDIDKLLGGPTRLIVAEKKNNSTASLVFGKSSFSKCVMEKAVNQECSVNGCMTCEVMGLPTSVTLWKNDPKRKVTVKMDMRCNCVTENCIYLYVCKLCKNNDGFYVGQTTNTCRSRANGHRSDFNYIDYSKSALSYHVYDETEELQAWYCQSEQPYDSIPL